MKKHVTLLHWFSALTLLVIMNACGKETDNTQYDKPTDFLQLEIGKYVIYRLDSTKFTNYVDEVINSYQAKDIVEGKYTDQLNRPTWRIQRYLRNLNSTNESDWKAGVAYEVIEGDNIIEVNENNLRFLKMQGPVKEGRSWKGNGYLPEEPYKQYDFSITEGMEFWEYTYEEFGAAELNGKAYDNTITITQINDSTDVPVIDIHKPASKTVWIEKYAKNIGLIYRDVAIWEYQPPTSSEPMGKKVGFGFRLSILDHN
jgi:hypothetical protein